MLAAAVHAGKGILMEKAHQSVAVGHLFQHGHGELIVVCRGVGIGIYRRDLMLGRSHLIVLGFGEYTQLPQFQVQIMHELRYPGPDGAVAALIQKKIIKHYSVVQIMQVLDAIIVCIGLYQFGLKPTLYAMIAIFVTTKVSDAVLEGFKYSKAAYIITDKHEQIAKKIMHDIDRGVTGLKARGMYTGSEKLVLYCVVSRREIVQVEEIVTEIDPDAFVIVSDVREVLGEGFQEYSEGI